MNAIREIVMITIDDVKKARGIDKEILLQQYYSELDAIRSKKVVTYRDAYYEEHKEWLKEKMKDRYKRVKKVKG